MVVHVPQQPSCRIAGDSSVLVEYFKNKRQFYRGFLEDIKPA